VSWLPAAVLAVLLVVLVVALYGLALLLVRGHRRRTLMWVGWSLVLAGLIVIVGRTIAQAQLVSAVTTDASIEPAANDAYSALQSFISDYPLYERRPEADYMLEFVTGLLARHELYVARFYLNQDKFEPAVSRIYYALKRFQRSGLEPEALALLGETRLKMHQYQEAREVFSTILAKYPASAFTLPARRFLKYLDEHPQPTTMVVQ